MLRSVNDLKGRGIRAADGDVGTIDQFFFDDESWAIRYLVVDTGSWLTGRKVLISPIALGDTDWTAEVLNVSLTKERIKNSPGIDTDKPVSRSTRLNTSTITATRITGMAPLFGVQAPIRRLLRERWDIPTG